MKLPQASSRIFKRRAVVLINVHVLGRGNGLEQLSQAFVWKRGSGRGEEERPTEPVVVLVHEMLQFPTGARSYLVALSLTLVILFAESVSKIGHTSH